jgi:hypothetical protein
MAAAIGKNTQMRILGAVDTCADFPDPTNRNRHWLRCEVCEAEQLCYSKTPPGCRTPFRSPAAEVTRWQRDPSRRAERSPQYVLFGPALCLDDVQLERRRMDQPAFPNESRAQQRGQLAVPTIRSQQRHSASHALLPPTAKCDEGGGRPMLPAGDRTMAFCRSRRS